MKKWFCKNITVKEGLIAKNMTEKNNRRVDCAEADKKTVQALHFGMLSELTRKGGDFWRLGIAMRSCPQLTYWRSLTAFIRY
ncbi:MAG: hypothetical protein GZ091_04990 [Paludibacter sp.]|nr:hypothetical protein [Paludibacter sp.]